MLLLLLLLHRSGIAQHNYVFMHNCNARQDLFLYVSVAVKGKILYK